MLAAEGAWNTREPERAALAYGEDSVWRNRDSFIAGRAEIVAFLTSKWDRDLRIDERDRRIFGPPAESGRNGELPVK